MILIPFLVGPRLSIKSGMMGQESRRGPANQGRPQTILQDLGKVNPLIFKIMRKWVD